MVIAQNKPGNHSQLTGHSYACGYFTSTAGHFQKYF